MVTSGVISEARINRLNGIVMFRRPERAITVLEGWAHDLRDLTDSLNKARSSWNCFESLQILFR